MDQNLEKNACKQLETESSINDKDCNSISFKLFVQLEFLRLIHALVTLVVILPWVNDKQAQRRTKRCTSIIIFLKCNSKYPVKYYIDNCTLIHV